MKNNKVYIIDASSLIALQMLLMTGDFFKPLFKSLESLINLKRLISHEEILKEIKGYDGRIYLWAKNQKNLFKKLNEKQINKVKEILRIFPKLIDPEKKGGGDPFLISLALVKEKQRKLTEPEYIIVTEEKWSNSTNKTGIPNVCQYYNLKRMGLNNFLTSELHLEVTLKNNT